MLYVCGSHELHVSHEFCNYFSNIANDLDVTVMRIHNRPSYETFGPL